MNKKLLSLILSLFTILFSTFSTNASQSLADATNPCVNAVPPTTWKVVVLVLENRTYSQVIGNSAAPYITSLANKCGTSRVWNDANFKVNGTNDGNYNSKPSYATFTSGLSPSTTHLTDDTYSTQTSLPSIYNQLLNAGISFKDYYGGGAGGCSVRWNGDYHDAIRYYSTISSTICNAHDVPISQFAVDYGSGNLPQMSFIFPNNSDSMHDNSTSSGDTYTKNLLTPFLNSSEYTSGHVALFLMFDEESPVPNVFVSPSVKTGSVYQPISGQNPVSHFAALRTWEELLGLPLLGDVGQAPSLVNFIKGSAVVTTVTPIPTQVTATKTNTVVPTITRTPTGTLQPSSTPTTTQIPSVTPSGSLTFPIRLAFFYPWFPEAWTQAGVFPYTNYTPVDGYYNSSDSVEISKQITEMKYANIQGGIASWWGQGTPTDSRIQSLLNTAQGTGFKWTLYYEQEGTSNPTSGMISNDLTYINTNYANNSNYLHISGKPVIFVYGDATDACSMVDRWNTANAGRFYVVLKVFAGYSTCTNQPSNWHQYSPAVATDQQGTHSYSISPGFWKVGESPRLVRDLTRFNQNVQSMIASNANFQLITTFSEWGEGTNIEPATEFGTSYLDALHNNGVVVSTPTTTPTSIPSATITQTPVITLTITPVFTVTPSPTTIATITTTPNPFDGWTCSEDNVLRICYQLK